MSVARTSGAEMGCRGRVRNYSGFVATHYKTGHTEYYPPSSSGDMPVALVKQAIDLRNRIYELTGSF